jgi:hypothetical protein
MDCPADFVVDGATAPLVTLSEGTVSTGLTTDACPNEFIVEVDHPDQFFARGVASFGGSLAVGTPSQQSCAQTFTLSLADLPATTGFVTVQTITDTASFQPGGLLIEPSCAPLPAITFSSAAQLPDGSDPIRFVTPAMSGVGFFLNIGLPAPPPPR